MNFSWSGFFIGLAIAVGGFLFIKFAYNLNGMMYFSWKNLGASGYKIVGILLIILSAFVMFGFLSVGGGDPLAS